MRTTTRNAEPDCRRVGLVGTFNLDLLLTQVDGEERLDKSPGGLCYSLGALRRLLPAAELLPLAWLSCEDEPEYRPLLSDPHLRTDGLRPWPGPGNHIQLDCRSAGAKPERAELRVPPLPAEALLPALSCAHLLLNCTSGRDVELDSWRDFVQLWRAAHPRGWLQMDWHSLSLDWREGEERRLRRVPRAFEWLGGLDLLQLTLEECGSLTARAPRSLEDSADLTFRLRKAGCRRVVVSDGARGFLLADGGGLHRQSAWVPARLLDTTGCGDVLGAALLSTLGCGWSREAALPFAAEAAGRVCEGLGLASLEALTALRGTGGPSSTSGLP